MKEENKQRKLREIDSELNEHYPKPDTSQQVAKFEWEHKAGWKKVFRSLKQYLKHHNYFYKNCKDEKKYFKTQIRILKDMDKKKGKLIKHMQTELKHLKVELERYQNLTSQLSQA